MGIRYLAISVNRDDYEQVKAGPCPTCGTRAHPSERHEQAERATLNLDKSWRDLQYFFTSTGRLGAASLVEGDVTHTNNGWISYQGCLSPEQVVEVGLDLASVTTADLRDHLCPNGVWRDDRSEQSFDYVNDYLTQAIKFTKEVVSRGRGIVYYIG